MKLKKQTLILFLTMLIIPMSYTQTLTESQIQLAQTYGIELTTSYSPQALIEILEIIDQELEAGIKTAYEQGYKAAVKEWQPKAIAYQTELEILKSEYEQTKKAHKKELFNFSLISGFSGLVIGNVSGILIGIKLKL